MVNHAERQSFDFASGKLRRLFDCLRRWVIGRSEREWHNCAIFKPKASNRTEIDVIFTLDEELGRSICRRRKVLGMTQAQLGAAVGVSFQQIQKNECGVNKMSAVQIWKIASALELSVDDLFADATRSPLKPKYSGRGLEDSAQFVELTAELQPRARHALTAFVQSLSTSA
jgi:transcriptional regulator with XRE-family HTH domain